MTTTVPIESGRVEVIATGLVDRDRQGRTKKDNRLRYDGAVFVAGQRLTVAREDVRALVRKQQLQVIADLPVVNFWAHDRLLRVEPGEMTAMADGPSAGAWRIVSGCGFDPGGAAYRFHNALTEYTPHGTAFVRYLTRHNNPYSWPAQINAGENMARVRSLILEADVVHCHIDPMLTQNAGLPKRARKGQVAIRHYHGTQFDRAGIRLPDAEQVPVRNAMQDDLAGYLLVGARLTLCALRPGRIQWLPIPMPVQRYSAMRPVQGYQVPTADRPFRVAHSPTRAAIKGTREFQAAIKNLQRKGVPVEAVLIEQRPHADALALKATADACFDSFALGIAGSGLEGAAMGQPVIAGDQDAADLHRAEVGYCPWTFAADAEQLEATLERLVLDPAFYADEQRRVGAFVRQYHDYPAVTARYQKIVEAGS